MVPKPKNGPQAIDNPTPFKIKLRNLGYSDCAATSQPGVKTIVAYLDANKVKSNCQAEHYYLLNNYNPGYYGDGTNAYTDSTEPAEFTVFTVPPSSVPDIGDALLAKNISFAYFSDQFDAYLADPYLNYVAPTISTVTSAIFSSTRPRS